MWFIIDTTYKHINFKCRSCILLNCQRYNIDAIKLRIRSEISPRFCQNLITKWIAKLHQSHKLKMQWVYYLSILVKMAGYPVIMKGTITFTKNHTGMNKSKKNNETGQSKQMQASSRNKLPIQKRTNLQTHYC